MDGKLYVRNDGTKRMEVLTVNADGHSPLAPERLAALEPGQNITIDIPENRALFARDEVIPA